MNSIMHKPEVIIFDLDGTLLDTIEDLASSCNYALAQADLPPLATNEYKTHVGSGAINLVESALASSSSIKMGEAVKKEQLDRGFIDKLYGIYNKHYANNWATKTAPYAGIEEMLIDLKHADMRLAVLSNKPDNFTREMVDHYFPQNTFDLVFGKRDDFPLKPDPASTLHICNVLDTAAADCALIGDSGSDIETAVRAQVQALGVLWGFRGRQELEAAGAQEIFCNVTELREWLLHNK